jgi:hypothetical protein
VWQFYLPSLPGMPERLGPPYGFRQAYVETFFGTFGSLEVEYPHWVYSALLAATLLGGAALLAALAARRSSLRREWPLAVVLLLAPAALIAVLHVAAYRSLALGSPDPLIVGRYLLPLVSLLGIGVALLVQALPRRVAPAAAGLVLAAGVALTLSGLGLSVLRFYG